MEAMIYPFPIISAEISWHPPFPFSFFIVFPFFLTAHSHSHAVCEAGRPRGQGCWCRVAQGLQRTTSALGHPPGGGGGGAEERKKREGGRLSTSAIP